ncbi:MAG: 7TM diverse intracellular signaling domain-containing protein, partial [Desulfococcaceae bacterium]|nr:7TM diverse intracellular signaling domain-containing protein [Desulfococcaceae bacterium]
MHTFLFILPADAQKILLLTDQQEQYNAGPYSEYLEDNDRNLGIEDVASSAYDRQFIPHLTENIHFGLSQSAYWLRFRIRNTSDREDTWLLEFGNSRLHFVEIYIPRKGSGGFTVKKGGYYSPVRREIQHRNFVFSFELLPGQEQTLYLRLRSISLQTPLTLWSSHAFTRKALKENLLFGFFYGAMLMIWAYHVFLWLIIRERSYFCYLFFVFGFIVINLADDGLGHLYFWGDFRFKFLIVPTTFTLYHTAFLLFTAAFLQTALHTPRLHKIIKGFIFIWLLLPPLYFFFPRSVLIPITYGFSLFNDLLLTLTGFRIWRDGFRPARYYLLNWSIFFVMGIIWVLGTVKILPVDFGFTGLLVKCGTLIQTLLFSLSLADRITIFREEKEKAQAEVLEALRQNEHLIREQNILLEQQVAERTEDLKNSENRYRSLFEDSPISMWEEDFSAVKSYLEMQKSSGVKDFRTWFRENPQEIIKCIRMAAVSDVNRKTVELYRARDKQELMDNLSAVFREESLAGMTDALLFLAEGKHLFEGESVNYTLNGEPIHLLVRSFVLPDAAENFSRVLVAMIDISERKQMEKELSEARDKAEAANRAKSAFLANMSHEIRTPMNAVIGFSDLLSSMLTDEKQKHYLDIIRSGGNNLLMLINDILELSKIESGKLELRCEPLGIRSVFEEMRRIFSLKTSEKNIELIIEVSDEIPELLLMDKTRFRQILFNLIGNGVKFTEKGYVKVSAVCEKGKYTDSRDLTVTVEDSGKGIPSDLHGKIFDPFEQEEQSAEKYLGTGLGLSITRRLVRLMNGNIEVKNKSGKGSIFEIRLRNVQIPEISSIPHKDDQENDIADIVFENLAVLLADDTKSNRELLKGYLDNTGIRCIEAGDGAEALGLAQQYEPDIFLTDIRMPPADGYAAARQIRNSEKLKDIPVIAVSASAFAEDREQIMQSGLFDAFLPKPVRKEELLRELCRFFPFTRKSGDPESPESEILPADVPEKLPELIGILEKEYMPLWEDVCENRIFNQIENFADTIRESGEEYGCQMLTDYGERLKKHSRNFDIGKISS